MDFEHKTQPVISRQEWLQRILHSGWLALLIAGTALLIGIAGYHFICGLPWVDAFLESSMILAGMGAIAPMTSEAAKIFAACYALFSGLVILTTTGVVLAPFIHRLLHHFHADRK